MRNSILIVDDEPDIRDTISAVLNDEGYETICASNAQEAQTTMNNELPSLIILDIWMRDSSMEGLSLLNWIKDSNPEIPIVMISGHGTVQIAVNAIKAGADGYLLKEINAKDLHDGIIETLNGGAAMNPSIALKTLKLLRNPITIQNKEDKEDIQLTAREIDVLEQLSKGLNYNKIAENLILSSGTVRKHIENIYRKLQVHNKLEAVQKAKRNKLI